MCKRQHFVIFIDHCTPSWYCLYAHYAGCVDPPEISEGPAPGPLSSCLKVLVSNVFVILVS